MRSDVVLGMTGYAPDPEEFRLVIPVIDKGGRLHRQYTDEGHGAKRGLSPPVEWYNLPEGTQSLVLVVEDIDAPDPSGPIVPWTVWVVANIPPTLKGLPEGFSGKEGELGEEYGKIQEGLNDEKIPGWRAPKLPSHCHRFEFKLYALDDEVHIGKTVTKEKLLEAIQGHILGESSVIAKV